MKIYDPNAIKLYVDGSANPNPGCGGVGTVVRYPDSLDLLDSEFSEGYKETTNNRMELFACIMAFKWLQLHTKTFKVTRAIIITDSEYVYEHKDRVQYWKKDGWVDRNGKRYLNEDVWDQFLKEWQKVSVNVSIEHEKGKTNSILKTVDKLAKKGHKNPTKPDYGYNSGKIARTSTAGKKASVIFPANGKEFLIRVYRYVPVGKGKTDELKVTFDLYSEEQKDFTQKHFAYTKIPLQQIHRHSCYVAKFNDNPKYPIIEEITPCDNPMKNLSGDESKDLSGK